MTGRRLLLWCLGLGTVGAIAGATASIPFHGMAAGAVWVGASAVTSAGLGLWLSYATNKDGGR